MVEREVPGSAPGTRRWLPGLGSRPGARARLFCLHYAGGGASMYRGWAEHLPDTEVVAVQLPGRENRRREEPYDRMGPLSEDLADLIAPHLDLPYLFFGYSMGARLAWVLSRLLRERGAPLPGALVVAASPGPCLSTPVSGWNESDQGLVRYLRNLGGTPPEVLEQPDLLSLVLPTVRADLTTVATWPYEDAAPLGPPLHALAGADDAYASPERMLAWDEETAGGFRLSVLPGGHFFVNTAADLVLDLVAREVADVSERAGRTDPVRVP